jgi:hypothetical protein
MEILRELPTHETQPRAQPRAKKQQAGRRPAPYKPKPKVAETKEARVWVLGQQHLFQRTKSTTIMQVKAMIESKFGIPVAEQRLYGGGRLLNEDERIPPGVDELSLERKTLKAAGLQPTGGKQTLCVIADRDLILQELDMDNGTGLNPRMYFVRVENHELVELYTLGMHTNCGLYWTCKRRFPDRGTQRLTLKEEVDALKPGRLVKQLLKAGLFAIAYLTADGRLQYCKNGKARSKLDRDPAALVDFEELLIGQAVELEIIKTGN